MALLELPQDFYEIYRQSIQRINQKSQWYGKLAERAFIHLSHARLSVDPSRLQRAVMTERKTFGIDEKFLPSVDMITSACEGLVSYDSLYNRFHLVHHTLQTYLDHQAADRSKDVQSNTAVKPTPKFNFGRSRGTGADDEVQPFYAKRLLDHVPSTLGDAQETGEEYRSTTLRFGTSGTFAKGDAKNDPTLERNMSWLFVSRGSRRLVES